MSLIQIKCKVSDKMAQKYPSIHMDEMFKSETASGNLPYHTPHLAINIHWTPLNGS